MVPVDEFLPIMYNRHPNTTWSAHFAQRSLKALSVEPLLVYPTHYTGEQGYVSDTEGTSILNLHTEPAIADDGVSGACQPNQSGSISSDGKDEL